LLAHGLWFSPASSTTKTGRHDIAESGVKQKKNQSRYNDLYTSPILLQCFQLQSNLY
jgi:hypothetical protein